MTRSPTTIFGLLAAMSGALSQVPGLPPRLQTASVAVSAMCVALLGFFAADAKPLPAVPVKTGILTLAIALLCVIAGCTLGGFGLDVSSPAFGSVKLDIGHGTIGSSTNLTHYASNRGTNFVSSTVIYTTTNAPACTNCTGTTVPNATTTNTQTVTTVTTTNTP